jgi:hypothetical protein
MGVEDERREDGLRENFERVPGIFGLHVKTKE